MKHKAETIPSQQSVPTDDAKLSALDQAIAKGIADAKNGRSSGVDSAFSRLRTELELEKPTSLQ